jgi:hypothetical protein
MIGVLRTSTKRSSGQQSAANEGASPTGPQCVHAAGWIDAARSKMNETSRTTTFAELPAKTAGAIAAIERGCTDALFTARHESVLTG